MIWDTRVLVYVFAQSGLVLLLGYGCLKAVYVAYYWKAGSGSVLQNRLEAYHDLLGTALGLGLAIEIALGIYFLLIINHFLPPLIKGAMCATGVLAAADYGYTAIGIKMAFFPLAGLYLALDEVETQKLTFVATPFKLYLIIPAFGLIASDMILSTTFLGSLSPDIITSCCSVENIFENQSSTAHTHQWIPLALAGCFGGFVTVGFASLKHNVRLMIAGLSVAVGGGFFSLKWLFIKYIYGKPNHDCLFDLFLPQHFGIGYILLAAYMGFVWSGLKWMVLTLYRHPANAKWIMISGGIAFFVPLAYYFVWRGELH